MLCAHPAKLRLIKFCCNLTVKEYNFLIKGKGKVMIVPVRYKKTHVLSEDKSMTLLILNFDAIWR